MPSNETKPTVKSGSLSGITRQAAGAATLLNASIAGTLALYELTSSEFITLAGLAISSSLAGWYLWLQRGSAPPS